MACIGVTFDLDGVLIVNPFGKGVFFEIRRHLAPFVAAAGGLAEEEAWRRIHRAMHERHVDLLSRGQWVSAFDWDDVVNRVAGAWGYPGKFDVTGLVEHFCTVPDIIDYHEPGVIAALAAVARGGARLGVVTNGYARYQVPVLRALALLDWFDVVLAPDTTGLVKPQPEIFQRARQAMLAAGAAGPGGGCTTWIHVGDSFLHDVCGPRAAGWQAVWLTTDMPEAMRSMAPWERVATPGYASYLADHLRRTPDRGFYPVAEDVLPDAWIYTLAELDAVLARLTAGDWRQPAGEQAAGG